MVFFSKGGLSRAQHAFNAALFFFGVWLIGKPQVNPWPEFGKAFGEAIIIAVFVIYLVERHSHKRLENTAEEMIRKIGKNIIPLVYGHSLPMPLVEALEASTLEQPIYRERMQIDAELESCEVPGADGPPEKLCRLRQTYRYHLVNCSDDPVTIPLRVYLERDQWLIELVGGAADPVLDYVKVNNTIYVDQPEFAAVQAKLKLPADIERRDLSGLTTPSPDGSALVFQIDKYELPAKGRVEIMFGGMLHKRYSDNEIWSTAFPTLGVELSATSTEFEVESRFPDPEELVLANLGGLSKKWAYDQPLLAGQAVVFWWRPKNT